MLAGGLAPPIRSEGLSRYNQFTRRLKNACDVKPPLSRSNTAELFPVEVFVMHGFYRGFLVAAATMVTLQLTQSLDTIPSALIASAVFVWAWNKTKRPSWR